MSWYGLITFCIAYVVAVATPGPGVAAIIARGLARGSKGAPAFIAGFAVGDLCWFFAAALGLSALAESAHWAFVIVKYLGVAYLLFLAYKLWTSPPQSLGDAPQPLHGERAWRAFGGSLALTLGNPKAMIFFVALLPSVLPIDQMRRSDDLKVALAIAVLQPLVLGSYVLIATRARRFLKNPNAVKMVNRGSGTLMAAAAVAVATR